jgi:urea transport system ATP-binding protein
LVPSRRRANAKRRVAGWALLEVRNVAKQFGGIKALAGVNLTLAPGELSCIIGPNGCGKTTLFNVITGAFAPSSGTVHYKGRDITGLPPHHIARLGIARKFQVPGIYPDLTVAENLEVSLAAAATGPLPLLLAPPSAGRVQSLLDRFNLAGFARNKAGTLSHGLKQWLEIASLLAGTVETLLLDEPTAGLSAAETAATAQLIHELRDEHGLALLVIEHDMNFVRALACPVMVMLRGNIFRRGTYAEVQADPVVREAYLGQAAAC